MTVTAVRKDAQSRTMTLEAEFDASPERLGFWARGKAAALRFSRLPALARQISEARQRAAMKR